MLNDMNITIEQLQLDELRAFLREQADDAFPSLKDEARLNMLAEKWHTYAEFCTCRNDDDCLVGMIAFYANQPESGNAYITHVYVNNEYRRKSLFSSMFRFIIDYVKRKGFRSIRLEVQKGNTKAERAYLNNGFRFIGGTNENSTYMQYEI